MKKQIVIINGSGGSGKDTLVHILENELNYDKNGDYKKVVTNISSVDQIKQIAQMIGWDGESKTDKDRKFLSDLKRITLEYNDYPFKYMRNEVYSFINYNHLGKYLFLHIREPEEIERAKEEFGAKTLLITRDDIDPITTNTSDKNVLNFDYDYVIKNNGTIEELGKKAFEFLNELDRS